MWETQKSHARKILALSSSNTKEVFFYWISICLRRRCRSCISFTLLQASTQRSSQPLSFRSVSSALRLSFLANKPDLVTAINKSVVLLFLHYVDAKLHPCKSPVASLSPNHWWSRLARRSIGTFSRCAFSTSLQYIVACPNCMVPWLTNLRTFRSRAHKYHLCTEAFGDQRRSLKHSTRLSPHKKKDPGKGSSWHAWIIRI